MLAACVPGAFGAWLLLLRDFGTWRLEDVLDAAIGYAEDGFPLVQGIRATIDRTKELLETWPASRDLYLPAPEVGALFRNPALAATYRRIVEESRGGSREEEIERARLAFYDGFVAEEIHRFSEAEGGLVTGDDLAGWSATLEPPVTYEYRGLTVCKTDAWGTGPVALQQLALLQGFPVSELSEAELVHVVTECAKLAFADRDALYGDAEVRLDILLSDTYASERRELVGEDASGEYTPGYGRLPRLHEAADDGRCRRAEPRHVPPRRRRPPRQPRLGDAERRLAPELAGHPCARLAARDARADVLARGGPAVVAAARRPPADDALTRPRAPGRQAVPGVGNAGRRPAGAVGAARLPPARRPRPRPAGGDRRARVPHRSRHLVLLSARLRAQVALPRVALPVARRRRPARGAATT